MKPIDHSLKHDPNDGWQILGKLELPAGAYDSAMGRWFGQILGPLNLQAGLLAKILEAVQVAVSRANQLEAGPALQYLRLFVFAPAEYRSNDLTWGFFLIEQVENAAQDHYFPEFVIELYLYREGQ